MTLRPEVARELANEQARKALAEHQAVVKGPDYTRSDPLVEWARRRLPPEEWCALAEAEAERLGMRIDWRYHRGDSAGSARAWAMVRTSRGTFTVAPQPGQTWQQALAEIGIEPGESPE